MLRKRKINPAGKILLSFVCIILLGTFLLCLPISSKDGKWFSVIDSLLTSTSAVCVTGLVAVDTGLHFSIFGQIVILFLIQVGGIGFITLTSLMFLIIGKKISYTSRLTIQESLNQETNQGVVKLVKHVLILVFSVEAIGFLCLAPSMIITYGWGKGIFVSIFLSVSAFCNAGFDILGGNAFASLAPFANNSLVLTVIMLLIVIGGMGYLVIFDLLGLFKHKKLSFHSKIVLIMTSVLIFSGAFVFMGLEWNNPQTIGNMNAWDKIVNSFFQSVTLRTAGFSTFNQAALSPASIMLSNVFMFIGGSPTSTAGGVKTTTIFILLIAMFKTTNNKGDLVLRKKRVENRVLRKCLRVVCLNLLLVVLSTFIICMIEGNSITVSEVIFETISAVSTVGLSFGITPNLFFVSKIILCLLMFVGRVGSITITVAFANKVKSEDIEYPDSKIIVG